MTKEIVPFDWTIDSALERADAQYIAQYFNMLNIISRQRMNQRAIGSQFINDAVGALIAFIQDDDEQQRLWKRKDELMRDKMREFRESGRQWDNTTLMSITNSVSIELLAEIHVWFSRFWSITQMQVLHFTQEINRRDPKPEGDNQENAEDDAEKTAAEEKQE